MPLLPLLRRVLKGAALLTLVGAVVLVAFLWLEHRSDTTLPTPTGPFAVGREIQDWTDPLAVDTLAPTPAKRELLVWIWYPATPGQSL